MARKYTKVEQLRGIVRERHEQGETYGEIAASYGLEKKQIRKLMERQRRKERKIVAGYFGSEAYSKEELIAEIGASALVNVAGLETAKSFRNSTAYIQNWLSVLRNDKRFIVSASGKAEKAVSLILGSAG